MSEESLLEPDTYATLVAWAAARSGRRVRVDSVWEAPDWAPVDGHVESYEGRLTVWAQPAREGACSTVALGLKGVPDANWLFPDGSWPEGAISATVEESALRIVGPQGRQVFTDVVAKLEELFEGEEADRG